MTLHRGLFAAACLLGLVGVAAGAFGAHGLRDQLTPARLQTFQTAVRYQLIHAPVVLVVAGLAGQNPAPLLRLAGWLLVGGAVVFAGSLYLLVLADLPALGAVTPLGGVGMLTGWVCLLIAGLRR
jgi:uncharacterized membrane protein YgdD (TMEM256/DUF423 family)